MGQTPSSAAPTSPGQSSPPLLPQNSLVRLGGSLGVAGSCVGLLIMLVACCGFDAVLRGFPLIPLMLAGVGLPLSIVGALRRTSASSVEPQKYPMEDTRILFSFFVNFLGLVGGLVEVSVWQHWATFSLVKG